MWNLYLDESGDLGFDFVNKKPSKHFIVTIVAVSSEEQNRQIIKAVKKTLKRKLNRKKNKKRSVEELKATGTTFEVKQYFYHQMSPIKFGIYSIILNKRRIYEQLSKQKERIYNYIARKVLDAIPFEKAQQTRIKLIVDKSKAMPEIKEFDTYIRRQLEARIDPHTPLDIYHRNSKEIAGLQAADLFSWGIFQKYEKKKEDWYALYKEKILFENLYLP